MQDWKESKRTLSASECKILLRIKNLHKAKHFRLHYFSLQIITRWSGIPEEIKNKI